MYCDVVVVTENALELVRELGRFVAVAVEFKYANAASLSEMLCEADGSAYKGTCSSFPGRSKPTCIVGDISGHSIYNWLVSPSRSSQQGLEPGILLVRNLSNRYQYLFNISISETILKRNILSPGS